MFLKRVEMQGFKSFADRTVITFDSDYTGIVGPNGCGKSNITDAIKWVLGEQSAKNMRGSSMSDVVFAGAEGKKSVNVAEVTLVFDNSKHHLNSDFEELEVTRRLYKNTSEGEYFINNSPCRLKDIQNLILDSGIGRDSLSMISQGNIQSFAEAKPIDRRGLFEEAAGVAKYKKRKDESLSKLAKTEENIERLNDIVDELEKQVSPLRRQARKAELYKEKKARLTEIEVAVIVNDIKGYIDDLATVDKELFDLEYQDASISAAINVIETSVSELRSETLKLDSDVNVLQEKLMRILNEIQSLEKRKVEIDEKRRYIKQTGSDEAKVKETKAMMEEAKAEYEDRLKRVEKTEADMATIAKRINDYRTVLAGKSSQLDEANNRYNFLNNRKTVLEEQLKSPYQHQAGVKAIVNAKGILNGILGVVSEVLHPDDGYQLAVSTALGGALYNIITKDEAAARNAISFLKKNKSGQATFLPLNVMRPRKVNDDLLFVAENTDGFLGLASDFVDCDEIYDPIVLSLLGNVMLTENLKQANELAHRTKFQFKIVTLDGDVVHRGGSMSGGYNRQIDSPLTLNKQLEDIIKQVEASRNDGEKLLSDYNKINKLIKEDEETYNNYRVALSGLNEVLAVKRNKYENLADEYNRIKPDKDEEDDTHVVDELIDNLNKAYATKDEITSSIAAKRARRINATSEANRKEAQLRQQRNALNTLTNSKNRANMDKVRLTTMRDNLVERLGREYEMTYDYASNKEYNIDIESAKEEVKVLRNEISTLGNVNLDAPEQFNEVNGRYENMVTQLKDLNDSKAKLLEAINEMDDVMSKQFMESFNKINDALTEVFTVLFGGGKAKLVLEDPNDVLNTGIDINVQPPGKTIQNIRLFSGGEKALIAICVLFAILKVRNVPLCIFDEIEASLDQGNVDRFARYIHNFSEQSQFIVITHRPGTMTECDILYGVTMEQKGVSKIIKVKLKEALGFAGEQEDGVIQ